MTTDFEEQDDQDIEKQFPSVFEDEPERPCDPDDIFCQMNALHHLKGLQEALGNERFLAKFPEFAGAADRIQEMIEEDEANLKETLSQCVRPVDTSQTIAEEEIEGE